MRLVAAPAEESAPRPGRYAAHGDRDGEADAEGSKEEEEGWDVMSSEADEVEKKRSDDSADVAATLSTAQRKWMSFLPMATMWPSRELSDDDRCRAPREGKNPLQEELKRIIRKRGDGCSAASDPYIYDRDPQSPESATTGREPW
jgi:hypothetical protein